MLAQLARSRCCCVTSHPWCSMAHARLTRPTPSSYSIVLLHLACTPMRDAGCMRDMRALHAPMPLEHAHLRQAKPSLRPPAKLEHGGACGALHGSACLSQAPPRPWSVVSCSSARTRYLAPLSTGILLLCRILAYHRAAMLLCCMLATTACSSCSSVVCWQPLRAWYGMVCHVRHATCDMPRACHVRHGTHDEHSSLMLHTSCS